MEGDNPLQESTDQVVLNERTMSQEEFAKQKADLESKPGIDVKEVGPGKFRSRICG